MTGQGHTRMNQIKASRPGVALDLSLQYKTANGHLVRGLQFQHSNKLVYKGQVIDTANNYRFIVGQVKAHDKETGTQEWGNHYWYNDGRHFFHAELNLVRSEIKQLPQPTLF